MCVSLSGVCVYICMYVCIYIYEEEERRGFVHKMILNYSSEYLTVQTFFLFFASQTLRNIKQNIIYKKKIPAM